MNDRRAYLWMAAGPVALIVVAGLLLVISSSTPARAVAFALFGIACVIAVSLVFFAVGRSEDAERAAAQASAESPPEDPPHEPPQAPHEHERPAVARRRPRPPRRPS
jgi:Na+/melibiose symporter-like transporter